MSAIDLVGFGWGRLRPRGADSSRGVARVLRAAEMRPKTSGSNIGGPPTVRGDCSSGEGGMGEFAARVATLWGR